VLLFGLSTFIKDIGAKVEAKPGEPVVVKVVAREL